MMARYTTSDVTVIGLIVSPLLVWTLWILAVMTNVTAVQRIFLVWQQSRRTAATDP